MNETIVYVIESARLWHLALMKLECSFFFSSFSFEGKGNEGGESTSGLASVHVSVRDFSRNSPADIDRLILSVVTGLKETIIQYMFSRLVHLSLSLVFFFFVVVVVVFFWGGVGFFKHSMEKIDGGGSGNLAPPCTKRTWLFRENCINQHYPRS